MSRFPRPMVLCVLDGWGYREERDNNAVALARTPVYDRLWATSPHTLLNACEEEVGLPKGQIGNSEVGHMNLGAGRVVYQDLPKIDRAIAHAELEQNPALLELIGKLHETGGVCHILGLMSPGGVHSHQSHILALSGLLSRHGIPVVIHAFMDGRDVAPQSGLDSLSKFVTDAAGLRPLPPTIGTVTGRYYAMDRDRRWDRVEKAYRALVDADGTRQATDGVTAVQASYAENVTDEFILPTITTGYAGMKDGDGLIMANFRADRAREILTALLDPDFSDFPRSRTIRFAAAVGMVEYSKELNRFLVPMFPPRRLENTLGQVIADAGRTQLRIAETEKYPHVTFFFNGGEETCYPGEERILVPSPKVATYDLQPTMSAQPVTDKLVEAIADGRFDLVVVNFANPDMVGHTGFLDAAMAAVETVDHCLGRLEAAVREAGGTLLITADHGNCEVMKDPETGGPHTAHTLDPVPVLLVNGPAGITGLRSGGRLADVAPTLLDVMGLAPPAEMTGRSLLLRAGAVG